MVPVIHKFSITNIFNANALKTATCAGESLSKGNLVTYFAVMA
jgi:hypothetical protein